MAKKVVILFTTLLGFTLVSVGIGRGEQPKEDYFDNWLFLMPQNLLVRVPSECQMQSYDSYYNPLEQYLYCPNLDENLNSVYISLESNEISYVSFRPKDLRYGDLIAIYGQPTEINVVRSRISSIRFGTIYVMIADRRFPIDYETRVLTIGFMDQFRRSR